MSKRKEEEKKKVGARTRVIPQAERVDKKFRHSVCNIEGELYLRTAVLDKN